MFRDHSHSKVRVSSLCRDPALAAIFRRAEDDGIVQAEVNPPRPPRCDGAIADQPILELA